MTANVNVFYFTGVVSAAVAGDGGRFSSDSVLMLQHPYLSRDAVSCDTTTTGSTTGANAGQAARIARVEVEDGKSVYCEINPPNGTRVPDTGSPKISGSNTFNFGEGWTLSFLEVA